MGTMRIRARATTGDAARCAMLLLTDRELYWGTRALLLRVCIMLSIVAGLYEVV